MFKKITNVLVGLSLLTGGGLAFAADGQVYSDTDLSAAIRVHNTGAEKVGIVITTNGAGADCTVTIGATVTTIDGSGDTDTVAEFAAAVAACENSAGKKVLVVDTGCVVATTESTDGELVDVAAGGNVIYPGDWGSIKWDTSVVKHYDAYLPASSKGADRGGATTKDIYGNSTGSGAISVKAYVDGAVVLESADGSTNAIETVDIAKELYVGANERLLVRITRATTATAGGAGATVEYK